MIYLDYAATTPMSEEAIKVYTEVAGSYYGNAISLHNIGTTALELLETSRSQLAELLGARKEGLHFTSGGSESNILALEALIKGQKDKGKHIISTITEHSSIYNYLEELRHKGFEVTYLPVDKTGLVSPEAVKKAIRPDTIVATIHYGNGELGTIQPVEAIGQILQEADILYHSDCAQTFGKLPLDLRLLPMDSISISSPKLYGPKGVGAVYIDPTKRWVPQYAGTTHESGFKPGTVNVPGVCAFVTSAKAVVSGMMEEGERLHQLRKYFINQLSQLDYEIFIEGNQEVCLPHIVAIRVAGIEAQLTMLELNRYGIAISTGSACLVGQSDPPRVMKALGYSDPEAKQYVRLSLGRSTTKGKLDQTITALDEILAAFFAKNKRQYNLVK